mmetsp:Transcript_58634/g.188538  ORF Transcript_58634/g.188538 Transcript_58634/m.188538 type:complete len:750 (+) Transcript_58634:95-2344(+)
MQINIGYALLTITLLQADTMAHAFSRTSADVHAVSNVVTLLQEIKAQVEKEATDDEQVHRRHECWCTTNRKQKSEAVNVASSKITELEAITEKASGLVVQLKNGISGLAADIAADKDRLAEATAIKQRDSSAFEEVSKDQKESIALLQEALAVLAKVQLLQRSGHAMDSLKVKPLLTQLKGVARGVRARLVRFRSVMQQDLWDAMSSLDEAAGVGSFMSKAPTLSTFEQQGKLELWAAKPSGLVGSTAGAKSYNSRSGTVVGILEGLKDGFEKNLGISQKDHLEALVEFHKLRSSKLAEIATATERQRQKDKRLVETLEQAARAKEDLQSTNDALSADQQFLLELEDSCKVSKEEYAKRLGDRTEELRTLSETIKILQEDDARDIFSRTMSFIQTSGTHASVHAVGAGRHLGSTAEVGLAQGRAINRAVKHVLRVAQRHHDWVFASLAVHMRLDAFTQVKEAMDRMLAELRAQQKAEAEKRAFCTADIQKVEDGIKSKSQQKEDLEAAKLGAENSIGMLQDDLDRLKLSVADMKASLKEAGESRKSENVLFQQSLADQRATIQILKKARGRLEAFYARLSLVQVEGRARTRGAQGAPVVPRPPGPKAYQRSSAAAGVLELLAKILEDAARAEAELVSGEQRAEESYRAFASDCKTALDADSALLAERTALLEQAMGERSETEGRLLANGEELRSLQGLLHGAHLDCDFLLQHFATRQQARSEEMSAIAEAKAILSGADFGNALDGPNEV